MLLLDRQLVCRVYRLFIRISCSNSFLLLVGTYFFSESELSPLSLLNLSFPLGFFLVFYLFLNFASLNLTPCFNERSNFSFEVPSSTSSTTSASVLPFTCPSKNFYMYGSSMYFFCKYSLVTDFPFLPSSTSIASKAF